MVVGLSPAQGEFTLPDARPERVLLISGGSGVTPVMSMLRTLCDEGHAGPITFVHYALTADDHIYRDEVAALAAAHANVRVVRDLHRRTRHRRSRRLLHRRRSSRPPNPHWADADVFVCGPPPLMNAVREHYADAGLAAPLTTTRRSRSSRSSPSRPAERSPSAPPARPRPTTAARCSNKPKTRASPPKYGCRMGICHTCPRLLAAGHRPQRRHRRTHRRRHRGAASA